LVNGVAGQIVRQPCPFRNIAQGDCHGEVGDAVGKNVPVENGGLFLIVRQLLRDLSQQSGLEFGENAVHDIRKRVVTGGLL
jgi:hypothetical protein